MGDMTNAAVAAFIAKVDAFAQTLDPTEQAMLAELIGDDVVAGFGFTPDWPGLATIAPLTLGTASDVVKSGGGNSIFRADPAAPGQDFSSTASGIPTV